MSIAHISIHLDEVVGVEVAHSAGFYWLSLMSANSERTAVHVGEDVSPEALIALRDALRKCCGLTAAEAPAEEVAL